MMKSQIESKLKSAVEDLISWPIRWKNERWADNLLVSDGNMPITNQGRPMNCIEGEVEFFSDTSCVGKVGNQKLRSTTEGMLRLYLAVGQGTGMTELNLQVESLATSSGLKRKTIFVDDVLGQRLYTMDAQIHEDIGEDGNLFVILLRFPWVFEYLA